MARRATDFMPADAIACIYGLLGERDDEFRWLETAVEEQALWLGEIGVEPIFAPLRSDPRFEPFCRHANIQVQPLAPSARDRLVAPAPPRASDVSLWCSPACAAPGSGPKSIAVYSSSAAVLFSKGAAVATGRRPARGSAQLHGARIAMESTAPSHAWLLLRGENSSDSQQIVLEVLENSEILAPGGSGRISEALIDFASPNGMRHRTPCQSRSQQVRRTRIVPNRAPTTSNDEELLAKSTW